MRSRLTREIQKKQRQRGLILNPFRHAAAAPTYFFQENFNGSYGCTPNNLVTFNEPNWVHLNGGSTLATTGVNKIRVNSSPSSIKTPTLLATAPFYFYFRFFTPYMTRSTGLNVFTFWSRSTGGSPHAWAQRAYIQWGGSSGVWRWNGSTTNTFSATPSDNVWYNVWWEFTGTQFKWYHSSSTTKPASPVTTQSLSMYDEHALIFNGQSYWQNPYIEYAKMRASTSPIGDNPD